MCPLGEECREEGRRWVPSLIIRSRDATIFLKDGRFVLSVRQHAIIMSLNSLGQLLSTSSVLASTCPLRFGSMFVGLGSRLLSTDHTTIPKLYTSTFSVMPSPVDISGAM